MGVTRVIDPMLRAEHVRVRRSGRVLLDDVTIQVESGEVVAILGPNGAGKSTLLATLSGDLDLEAGTVSVAGRALDAWGIGELSRQRGVLLQENRTAFAFTVLDVVAMGRAPWRRTTRSEDDDAVVAWAMEIADVTDLAERRVPSLSGGERARTGFARVVAGQTAALLLDEPTAALDIGHQESLLTRTRQIARDGAAVAVVLHDLNLAAAYADRVVLMRGGRIESAGTPAEVLTAETISRVYGTPVEVIRHPSTGDRIILPLR